MQKSLVDQLLIYVQEQLRRGYSPEAIKNVLLRQGRAPAIVDGVIQSAQNTLNNQNSQQPVSRGENHEKKLVPMVLIIIGILIIGGLVAVFVPKLMPKDALLDVIATGDKYTYMPAEELGFEVEITNMGSSERFDIELTYRILDENKNTILTKTDTKAISTTISHHETIKIPRNMIAGTYELKVFANYEEKLATSSFTFEVEEAETIVRETCFDNIKNQDETNIDCGGVCEGYWYNDKCYDNPQGAETPEPETPTTPNPKEPEIEPEEETCFDNIKNQDEVGPDCGGTCGGYWYNNQCNGAPKPEPIVNNKPQANVANTILEAKKTAKEDSEKAAQLCLEIEDQLSKDKCYKIVSENSNNKKYCDLIENVEEKDMCYYPFFMKGDYTVCEELKLYESRQACEQLRDIELLSKQAAETE